MTLKPLNSPNVIRPAMHTGRVALAAAIAAMLALAACNRDTGEAAAPPPTATIEPGPVSPGLPSATATSSLNVSAVTLGTSTGPDGRIATPITTFTSSDPVVVSIDTSGAATDAELTARLVFQDGQTAGEQSQTITSSGADTTNITFTNANGWPAGSYRAEIWVGGTQAQSREFTVR